MGAKQTLVNLLFKPMYSRKGPDAHRKLDVASYSYVELRDAYLKRIQLIHPDKCTSKTTVSDHDQDSYNNDNHKTDQVTTSKNTDWNDFSIGDESYKWDEIKQKAKKKSDHDAFIELQEAWKKYEKLARSMQKGKSESEIRGVQENFTLFGVGCSFSDNNDEKYKRSKIMDQACKGWCASGALSETTASHNEGKQMHNATDSNRISLIDDELFVDMNNDPSSISLKSKKSLIDHLVLRSKAAIHKNNP